MNQKKSCANCIKGTKIMVNNDILCREKGAVSRDFHCSKHRFMPNLQAIKEVEKVCINCCNFLVDSNMHGEESSIGLCQLFSVRKFDGKQKKACSKFNTSLVLEVS